MAKADGSDIGAKVKTQTETKAMSPAQQKVKSVNDLIESLKPQLARALPAHMKPDKFARLALTTIRTTPKLLDCNQQSLMGAIMTAGQLGLEFGPLGHVYLVPYNNKKLGRMDAQLIIGYKGYMELVHRSGEVSPPYVYIVYEKDFYEREFGLERKLVHKPPKIGEDRGKPIAVYAVAKMKDGDVQYIEMTMKEVDAIRRRSAASDSGPWVTDHEAMVKKTAIKQLCKWLPLSIEVSRALTADETIRTEIGEDMLDVPTIEVEYTEVSDKKEDDKGVEPPVANPVDDGANKAEATQEDPQHSAVNEK